MDAQDVKNVLGQLFAGGAALAGLVLVFLGSIITAYDAYETTDKPAVKGKYQRRAWIAFAGFLASLISAGAALAGLLRGGSFTWLIVGLITLGLSAILLVAIALLSVLEVA
jgi:hypothetical protein